MILQITLGDVIGWIITILSVGIAVTVNIRFAISRKGNNTKVNQSRSQVIGDQVGGNKIGGD